MKLGTLKNSKHRDGDLIVASRDLKTAVKVPQISTHMLDALERWDEVSPQLQKIYDELNVGKRSDSFVIDHSQLLSCMPRTYLFADGSAFIHHIKLVRMARKAAMPATLETVPLMYQAECSEFLAPTQNIPQVDFSHGTDFEAEVGVITGRVPMQTSAEEALKKIKLFVILNDVSLRGLIPAELEQGFGFFVSKPAKTLSPFAITPDELGANFKNGRVHLPLHVKYNGQFFGQANAGEMHFHFGQLIAHACQTRNLQPGTLIGSGTVANENPAAGSSCLAEKRMLETINEGSPKTPFMKVGDQVRIEMFDEKNNNLFGTIEQKVEAFKK